MIRRKETEEIMFKSNEWGDAMLPEDTSGVLSKNANVLLA